jgi:hypothetical protein
MDRVFYSERVILRCSPEPKLGRISIARKQQGQLVLVTGGRHLSFPRVVAAAALAAVLIAPPAHAQRADAGDWIETWTASPQPVWDPEFLRC